MPLVSLDKFLDIYPRLIEIDLLQSKLQDLGFKTPNQGIKAFLNGRLSCGGTEHFLLKVLTQTGIHFKASIMQSIHLVNAKIKDLACGVHCWKIVLDQISNNKFLIEIITIMSQQRSRSKPKFYHTLV